MKNLLLPSILMIFIVGACSHKSINVSQEHRDSIMNSYLLTSDSFWFVNPQNRSLSLINAYYNGDLNVLKLAYENLKNELSYERVRNRFYEELGIEKLNDLKFNEVYFFLIILHHSVIKELSFYFGEIRTLLNYKLQ